MQTGCKGTAITLSSHGEDVFADVWAKVSGMRKPVMTPAANGRKPSIPSADMVGAGGEALQSALCMQRRRGGPMGATQASA